jgi:HEAT repeat protein
MRLAFPIPALVGVSAADSAQLHQLDLSMKQLLIFSALVILSTACLQDISMAHGGTYRGPGDTVPPGGGGGGGGGAGPSGPGAAGPSTGGPSGPAGAGPSTGGPATGGPAARPAGPVTGSGPSGPDLTLWEFWWGFNKDQYLNLKSVIYAGVYSGSDEYFLGTGTQRQAKNSLKPSEEAIRQKIVPALEEALQKERANDIVTGAMVALAKIGDAKNESGESEFEKIIAKFLSDGSQEIHETAAVALGILANDSSVKTLESLLKDTPQGRAKVGNKEVDFRTRAFAAYGLGLIGARTASNAVRQDIAGILIDALGKTETSQRDVKVAALIALGLVPIDVDKSEAPDSKPTPTSSRQGEIKFILKFFQDPANPFLVRAHAPTAVARLLKDAPADLRETTAKLFLEALGDHSKEQSEVQGSCVLALGQIGTCESDKLDKEIRETLKHIGESGKDAQAKNFAMISLAQIGGRYGSGENIEDGVKDTRNFLLTNMTKGKSPVRPWAGLAVGVMERAVLDNKESNKFGQTPNSISKETLRTAMKTCADPEHLGAYAIGCGIAKDSEAKDILLDKLKNVGSDQAKGYVTVALGLMDARESIKSIQEIVRESKYKPDLMKQAAIGLGLLGDKELVPDLVKMLAEAKGLATQSAVASALGFIGDSRSIDPLVEMLKNTQITQSARGFAAVALGIVADKEMYPWYSKISTNINYRANTTTLTDSSQGNGILDLL